MDGRRSGLRIDLNKIPYFHYKLSTMETPDFPNGFASWQRTHFEVVEVLIFMRNLEESRNRLKGFASGFDHTASDKMYELALHLTNKYEEEHKGKVLTRTFFDEIERFVWGEIKSSENLQ